MTKKPQTEQILLHLMKGKRITPIDALNKFGCFRLAARIAELRKSGHNIWTDSMQKDGKTFAAYSMSKNIKLLP